MAIFGIGASYDNTDVSGQFINKGVACIGWSSSDASSLHEIMKSFKIGDIVYIKSSPINSGLRIKAVGIVEDNNPHSVANLGTGVKVKWIWKGKLILDKITDKYNVRNNTLYEEFNKEINEQILRLIFQKLT